MRVSSLSRLAFLVVILTLTAALWLRWKTAPPYELGTHTASVQTSATPHTGPCPVFPAGNIWNTRIETLPKLPASDTYIDSIGPLHKMHPDFGSNLAYGIPYTEVPPNTPPVPVTFEYREDSDPGPYPIPPDAPIEGGPAASGDRHVLLVDQANCILYELYHATPQSDGSWTAGSGIKNSLTSNALRPDGKTSADAAGLPIFPGLVRYEEASSGAIHHALRFTIPHTQASYVWPARHRASSSRDPALPPLGTRFRLRPGFDTSRYSPRVQAIMKALQRYGMFLADNGSPMYLSGVSDKRWSDRELRKLSTIAAEDFEAVDESSLQRSPNSAEARSIQPAERSAP